MKQRKPGETALTVAGAERQQEVVLAANQVAQLASLSPRQLRQLNRSLARQAAQHIDRLARLEADTQYEEAVAYSESRRQNAWGRAAFEVYDEDMGLTEAAGLRCESALAATSRMSESVRDLIQSSMLFGTSRFLQTLELRRSYQN